MATGAPGACAAVDGIVAGLRATAAPAGVAVGDDARAGG
jgi:hypothetical protein